MEGLKTESVRFVNVFSSFLKQLEVSSMLATPDEVGMPFFAPFIETEKDILKEAEDELRKNKNSDHIASVLLNRGMPSTSEINVLRKMVEKIEISQQRMETSVEGFLEFLKSVELKMNNRWTFNLRWKYSIIATLVGIPNLVYSTNRTRPLLVQNSGSTLVVDWFEFGKRQRKAENLKKSVGQTRNSSPDPETHLLTRPDDPQPAAAVVYQAQRSLKEFRPDRPTRNPHARSDPRLACPHFFGPILTQARPVSRVAHRPNVRPCAPRDSSDPSHAFSPVVHYAAHIPDPSAIHIANRVGPDFCPASVHLPRVISIPPDRV
uniref:Uncharacterized protein n=1 Tax=Cucumis melo TaxID=3656 RepID=A0A9I9EGY5_CUCME